MSPNVTLLLVALIVIGTIWVITVYTQRPHHPERFGFMTPSTFLRLIKGDNIATPDLCLDDCQQQFYQCIEENDDNPQLGRSYCQDERLKCDSWCVPRPSDNVPLPIMLP